MFGPWKKWPQMAPNTAGRLLFLLIQTLPTFLAERIWILRFLFFFICWTPHFWISRSPDLQIPRFPDAGAGASAAGRILRSQPDPSPNAPRDQIRRKDPCCGQHISQDMRNDTRTLQAICKPIDKGILLVSLANNALQVFQDLASTPSSG